MSEIRTYSHPHCYLCGSDGKLLYQGIKDRLFDVPGDWNLKQCSNLDCGLVWLDPMPKEEDIGKLYANYYTHQDNGNNTSIVRKSYLLLYDLFLSLTKIKSERHQLNLLYLDKTKPGKLLEIGCGSGSRLAEFKKLGWEVQGQEIDTQAANFATKTYDIPVHIGTVENAQFPDNSFDAIIINHVIEHISNPIDLLKECHRLLKPSGTLVLVTPNINSYGHRYFGLHWLGLDTPRHLYLFSQKTLEIIAFKSGFSDYNTWTSAANTHVYTVASLNIQKDGHHLMKKYIDTDSRLNKLPRMIKAVLLQLSANRALFQDKDSGDDCVLKAIK